MASSASFQKKTRTKTLQIPGSKPSLFNNQLLISTGVPSFDNIIGGGLAVGTVLLIGMLVFGFNSFKDFAISASYHLKFMAVSEEDVFGSYAKLLLKYFLAEAVMTDQAILLSSAECRPEQLLKELPQPILDDPGEGDILCGSDEMKIAWRYQNLPQFQSNPTAVKFGHYYDLTKSMSSELIDSVDKILLHAEDLMAKDGKSSSLLMDVHYQELLQLIQATINSGQFATRCQPSKRNILRIGIHSLGSPLWVDKRSTSIGADPSLPVFLFALRSILRSAYATCLVTVPTHIFQNACFTKRIERLCDTVVQLESFTDLERKNSLYKDYHGLFNIKQLPRLNSLTCHMPDTLDWAFKIRRKKLTIEKLHLPPEISETASRTQEDVIMPAGARPGCGLGGRNVLDF